MAWVYPEGAWPRRSWPEQVWPEGGDSAPPTVLPDVSFVNGLLVLALVADKTGRIIGELQPDVAGVAWKLNDYGQARMTLARSAADENLLRFGNRILLQFDNGLPDWGGVIDTPRDWDSGRVEVVAYSGEYLLKWRITDRGRYFSGATAGAIFQAVIREAKPFGVELGSVWVGGVGHSPEYHYERLYDIAQKSLTSRLEDVDWDVTARQVSGRIAFRANFYQRRGTDRRKRIALLEGVNAADVELSEQGGIANDIYLAGGGSGWGEASRIYADGSDTDSQSKYGLRQWADVRVDITRQGTLDEHAAMELAARKEPRRAVSLKALNLPPGRYGDYTVGDTVWLEVYEAGFGGYAAAVRLVAREYLPRPNVCSLVVV